MRNRLLSAVVEPVVSLSVYALLTTAALVLLGAGGFPATAAGLAAGLAGYGVILELMYLKQRRGASLPEHRRRLDRLVRLQWAGCAAVTLAAMVAGSDVDLSRDARTRMEFVDGAVLTALFALWLSALIDWYWVLPRMAGIGCAPPCQTPYDGTWNSVTKVWLYHRAIATMVFVGGIAAIPGYFAVVTENAVFATVLTVVTFGVPAVMSEQVASAVRALRHGLNPPVPVGSIARVRLLDEQIVYIVDASLEGSKYKDIARPTEFVKKSDGPPIPNSDLSDPRQVEIRSDAPAPCADGKCRRYNWYCRHNPLAYSRRG